MTWKITVHQRVGGALPLLKYGPYFHNDELLNALDFVIEEILCGHAADPDSGASDFQITCEVVR